MTFSQIKRPLLTLGHTSKVILPPTHRGTMQREVVASPHWVFDMLQYFEKILPLVEILRCALQDEAHIMGCSAAGAL